VPLLGEAGSPCNTMWPGPRPTFVPSGILIHPAVWRKQTWAKIFGAVPLGVELGPHLNANNTALKDSENAWEKCNKSVKRIVETFTRSDGT